MIMSILSVDGFLSIYEKANDKDVFRKAYNAAYKPFYDIFLQVYEKISEYDESYRAPYPKETVLDSCWKTGKEYRLKREFDENKPILNSFTSGIYW